MLTCVYYSYQCFFNQLLVLKELRTVKTLWLDNFNAIVLVKSREYYILLLQSVYKSVIIKSLEAF